VWKCLHDEGPWYLVDLRVPVADGHPQSRSASTEPFCYSVPDQLRTQDFIFWGINLTRFYPVIAYAISKKNVVMRV